MKKTWLKIAIDKLYEYNEINFDDIFSIHIDKVVPDQEYDEGYVFLFISIEYMYYGKIQDRQYKLRVK